MRVWSLKKKNNNHLLLGSWFSLEETAACSTSLITICTCPKAWWDMTDPSCCHRKSLSWESRRSVQQEVDDRYQKRTQVFHLCGPLLPFGHHHADVMQEGSQWAYWGNEDIHIYHGNESRRWSSNRRMAERQNLSDLRTISIELPSPWRQTQSILHSSAHLSAPNCSLWFADPQESRLMGNLESESKPPLVRILLTKVSQEAAGVTFRSSHY